MMLQKKLNMQLQRRVTLLIGLTVLFYLASYNFNTHNYDDVPAFGPQDYFSFIVDPTDTTVFKSFRNATIRPPGVVANPTGGIGNQLFQFACAYALARDKNWQLYVRTMNDLTKVRQFSRNRREWSLDQFHIPVINAVDRNSKFINLKGYKSDDFFDRNFKKAAPSQSLIQLNGHCQSEAFWSHYQDELTEMLQPSGGMIIPTMTHVVRNILQDIEQSESVAVHIRRGDFKGHQYFYVPLSFQRVAIRRMAYILKTKGVTNTLKFYVFSDDIDYVRKHFADLEEFYEFVYVSKTTSLQDFLMMTRCKHIIFPNSTFSWWAAYLNKSKNRTVLASAFNPVFFRRKNKRFQGRLYHLIDWTIIDVFSGET